MPTPQCAKCACFRPMDDAAEVGECRRHPPVVMWDTEAEDCFTVFPIVDHTEYCFDGVPTDGS
jgi:hypothetical protein